MVRTGLAVSESLAMSMSSRHDNEVAEGQEMTEEEWLACDDPTPMWKCLRGKASQRELQLFACACVRHVWHRLPDPRSRRAVELTEHFIEGWATAGELGAARQEAEAAQRDAAVGRRCDAGEWAAVALASAPEWTPDRWPCLPSVTTQASTAAAEFAQLTGKNRKERKRNWVRGHSHERAYQCAFLRDISGKLFASVSFDPPWRTPVVVTLAQAAYDERILPSGHLDPDRLAVLADALEDAGCDNADIISHLRGPSGPHVRGCFVLDLLLDKK
jgi:hypothetical protein